jgi:diguanylate cyclase (GGDEF)-like protein
MLRQSLVRVGDLVKGLDADSPRHQLELEMAIVQSHLAGLMAAHQALEQQNRQLLQLSFYDDVTRLYNQPRLIERLEEEFKRAVRYGTRLSLLIADLDDFTPFNDAWGYLVGNDLLRRVARLIRQAIRGTDIAGRYRADEFIILLPHTSGEQAGQLGQRVRAVIAGLPERVTVTIGIASLDASTLGPLELLAQGYRALYRAKTQRGHGETQQVRITWTTGTSSSE